MKKIELRLAKLQKAIIAIESIYMKPNLEDGSNIDATIQRFEFTFELLWKLLRDFFYQKGIDLHYPRDVLKEAYSSNLIDNETLWLQMLKDRNLTSHTYDEELANSIFQNIKSYVPIMRIFFDKISNIIAEQDDEI